MSKIPHSLRIDFALYLCLVVNRIQSRSFNQRARALFLPHLVEAVRDAFLAPPGCTFLGLSKPLLSLFVHLVLNRILALAHHCPMLRALKVVNWIAPAVVATVQRQSLTNIIALVSIPAAASIPTRRRSAFESVLAYVNLRQITSCVRNPPLLLPRPDLSPGSSSNNRPHPHQASPISSAASSVFHRPYLWSDSR